MHYIQIHGEGWYPCDSMGAVTGDRLTGTPQATLSKVAEGTLYTVWKVEAWGTGANPYNPCPRLPFHLPMFN